ncbi:hypothetical protein NDU88_006889 [Pleurodeles waltl]|uniref:Uncharacterized protein n=1 Tax=Pleurodeles waltl TaxID=8319 RepID=A0AAV7LTT4_PLEWA|nr:hypothetical protein NDU88_006889 [Pleurodeles waltl]
MTHRGRLQVPAGVCFTTAPTSQLTRWRWGGSGERTERVAGRAPPDHAVRRRNRAEDQMRPSFKRHPQPPPCRAAA